jgi:hypothetical protein
VAFLGAVEGRGFKSERKNRLPKSVPVGFEVDEHFSCLKQKVA